VPGPAAGPVREQARRASAEPPAIPPATGICLVIGTRVRDARVAASGRRRGRRCCRRRSARRSRRRGRGDRERPAGGRGHGHVVTRPTAW
jgi:hypothetical protein